jgi:acyl transferase domain-containing protein
VHGPTVTLSTKVTNQSTVGTGVAVDVTIGGPAVIALTGAQEQQANRQSNSAPTYRLASSPEAGLGATVSSLDKGYPLLQYKDTVHVRRLLATRRTAPDPTTWAGLGAPCGKER